MKKPFFPFLHQHEQQLKEIKISKFYKVWSSCMDGHSCPECVKLEGAAVPMNASFVVGNKHIKTPPLHDGCRCTLAYIEEGKLEHYLKRAYKSLMEFTNMANDSTDFHTSVSGYFGSVFFLEKIATAPASELRAAGLKVDLGHDLKKQLAVIKEHKDQIFNQAIKRSYDEAVAQASALKSKKGKQERLRALKTSILADVSVLSSSNIEFLNSLIP